MRAVRVFRLSSGLWVFSVCLLWGAPGGAVTLKATPSIRMQGGYDSNIFDEPIGQEEGDFLMRVSPRLELKMDTGDTYVTLGGGFTSVLYLDNTEENELFDSVNLSLRTGGPVRFSEKLQIVPTLQASESRDPGTRVELTEPPVPGLPPSEVIIREDSVSRTFGASLELIYLAAPRLDLSVGGGAATQKYYEGAPDTEDQVNYVAFTRATYRFTPKVKAGPAFRFYYVDFTDSSTSNTYTGGLTADYQISPYTTMKGGFGVSYTREEDEAGTVDTNWSPTFGLTMTYEWKTLRAGAAGSFDVAGISTFAQVGNRGNLRLWFDHQFAKQWSWSVSGFYQRNRSFEDTGTEDIISANLAAGIRYFPREWISFRLSANTYRQWDDSVSADGDTREITAFLGTDLHHTYILF